MKQVNENGQHAIDKGLTRAEEQVMQALWKRGSAYLKEVLEAMPEPRPHSNTVATLLKILIAKGFVEADTSSRNHLYTARISKQQYGKNTLGSLVSSYFGGSYSSAVSFLVDQQQLSVNDLELLLQQLKNK